MVIPVIRHKQGAKIGEWRTWKEDPEHKSLTLPSKAEQIHDILIQRRPTPGTQSPSVRDFKVLALYTPEQDDINVMFRDLQFFKGVENNATRREWLKNVLSGNAGPRVTLNDAGDVSEDILRSAAFAGSGNNAGSAGLKGYILCFHSINGDRKVTSPYLKDYAKAWPHDWDARSANLSAVLYIQRL